MRPVRILLVDDESSQRTLLAGYLSKTGYDVHQAASGEDALALYPDLLTPIVITDMKMTGMSGLELLEKLREINPFVQVLLLTAYGTIDSAVDAMRAGAFDFLTKPVTDLSALSEKLKSAASRHTLIVDQTVSKREQSSVLTGMGFVGESNEMNEVRNLIGKVAPSDATVLITGETGTGKELVANAIHAHSPRAGRKIVALNCAAFPETLIESELFGHEKGAYTSADKQKVGLIELANEGTLFLDEIGELPLTLQAKLLRVLEDRQFMRLGGTRAIHVDFRLIAATNRNLGEMIAANRFRQDLLYRINTVTISLPPLRKRGGDLLLLADHFLGVFARRHGKVIKGFFPDAVQLLRSYDWPGNVRELQNVIERGILVAEREAIVSANLSGIISTDMSEAGHPAASANATLAEVEKAHIARVLSENDWSLAKSADLLGIHRNTLRSKITEYNLTRD